MADVRSREAGKVIRLHEAARAVGLRVAGRHAIGAHERREAVIMVERAVLLHRSEEHTSELQSRQYLVCRLLLEKKKKKLHSDELDCATLVSGTGYMTKI